MNGSIKAAAIAASLALELSARPAQAQPAPQVPSMQLTLDDAIRRGLEASHRILEAAARGRAADSSVAARHAAALPQVALQGGYTRTNHVEQFGVLMPNNELRVIYPDIPDNYRARLDVQWPLYTGGRVEAVERAARADAQAAGSDIAALRADLTLEITRAYWAFVTARETSRVLQASLVSIDAHLRDVRNRLDAGLVPPNDVLSVEAQASRQRMLNIQAANQRDIAEAEVARLVGLPPDARIEPATPLAVSDRAVTEGVADLVTIAQQQRHDRAALVQRTQAARDRARAAAAGLKPTVAAGGGFDYARPNPRIFPRNESWQESWDASINVSWPLFDGGRARAETGEALEAARALEERLAEFDAVLTLEVRQRISEIDSARAAVGAAGDAVRASVEARRVVGDRFSAGVATSTEVLDAQVAVLQAELDRAQTIAAVNLAEARLRRVLGQ